MDIIQTILKDSNYHLALFTKKEIEDLQETIFTKITRGKEPPLYKACSVYLSGLRLSDGQLLIVANASFNPNAIEEYGLRWEIETLFGCLKGRGFNLEDTRVVGYLRMKKLFVLPVIAFCWSHKVVLVKSAR
jgi:hypothetical protein